MLDILVEALIELFNPKQQKQQPRRRGPQSRPLPKRDDGWPEPSADDPYRKDHDGDISPERTVTLEDLLRRAAGMEPARQEPPVRRRVPIDAASDRPAAPPPRQRPRPVQPAAQTTIVTQQPAQPPAAAQPQRQQSSALDYVAKLRNNPDAAREAFVFSEIFGRPLGDRRQ